MKNLSCRFKLKKKYCFSILELANGTGDQINDILSSTEAGPSSVGTSFLSDDLVSSQLDEDNSRQSSCDPLSPNVGDYSEDEGDSDTSSDDMN